MKLFLFLRKYYAIARINFAAKLAYPFDQVSDVLYLTFFLSVLFYFHKTAIAHASGSMIEGLSLTQVMWMVFIINVASSERTKGVSHLINEEILSGQIAYQLSRPYSYILFYFAQYIGQKIPTLLLTTLLCGVFMYTLVGFPSIHPSAFLIGCYMICVGLVINFLIQFCIGMCAFWIEHVDPLRWIYKQAQSIAGGAIIPLAFFPVAFKKVMLLLPFSHVVYGAVRVIIGCEQHHIFYYVAMQLMWLGFLIVIARILFKRGTRNVVVSGG